MYTATTTAGTPTAPEGARVKDIAADTDSQRPWLVTEARWARYSAIGANTPFEVLICPSWSATSTTLRPYLSLNGKVATAPVSPDMRLLQQAEQVAREVVATRPDIVLKDVELVNLPTGPVLIVSIESPRAPSPDRIARFEALLRERLGEEPVRVVIRVAESVDTQSKGRILFGEAHFRAMSEDEAHRRSTVEETARTNLEGLPNTFVTAIDAVPGEVGWTGRRAKRASDDFCTRRSAATSPGGSSMASCTS